MTTVTNLINISVYDLDSHLISGVTSIAVFRSATSNGTFTEITVSGSTRITLETDVEYYTYLDTGTDIGNYYYKFKWANATSILGSFITAQFKQDTSDLTEDLRYVLEDITSNREDRRYTIKELRRFVKIALYKLQSTPYRYRFKADNSGIIDPVISNMDKGVILMQAQIEASISQLLKAADTNISFTDGRGKFNNRSSEALRSMIKMLVDERDKAIKSYNKVAGNKTARVVMWAQMSGVST